MQLRLQTRHLNTRELVFSGTKDKSISLTNIALLICQHSAIVMSVLNTAAHFFLTKLLQRCQ